MKWYELNFAYASYFCERAGFICKPVDLFEMEVKVFEHGDTGLSFKYRQGMGDQIKFYISPFKYGKSITLGEFIKEWENYVNARKVSENK